MSAYEIELSAMDVWPKDAIYALSKYWLTNVGQVIALGATPKGVEQISTVTGLDVDRVNSLLASTRATLSASELRALETPVDVRDQGLGALPPRDED